MEKKKYTIAITISVLGNLAKFYKTYAKDNREIILENIEFKGKPDQHNTGILKQEIVCTIKKGQTEYQALQAEVEDFLDKNELHGEFFSIYKVGRKKELFTEDDF
jgi:hypothetical protein